MVGGGRGEGGSIEPTHLVIGVTCGSINLKAKRKEAQQSVRDGVKPTGRFRSISSSVSSVNLPRCLETVTHRRKGTRTDS